MVCGEPWGIVEQAKIKGRISSLNSDLSSNDLIPGDIYYGQR